MEANPGNKPIIIPVASGKGGVGKSVITANLAICLAEQGYRTIAVDLDLGASNLHTCLGLDNDHPGIGDYLRAHHGELEDLLVQTAFEHLHLLPGDVRSPLMANLHHSQKTKLMHRLTGLEADYLLLDIGSGSSYHILDFFGMSNFGMLICTFEHASLANMLTFLKNFALRTIEHNLPRNTFLKNTFNQSLGQPVTSGVVSIKRVLGEISKVDASIGEKLCREWLRFRPRIVFNQGTHPEDLEVAEQLQKTLKHNLSLYADYFGFLFHDPATADSTRKRQPLMSFAPESMIAEDIEKLADRIRRLWTRPLKDSARLLRSNTEKVFARRSELDQVLIAEL